MTLSNSTSMADQSVPDIAPTAVTELQSVMSASVEEKAGAREADGERNAGTNAKNTKKDEAEYSVPFFKLFAYADLVDVLLMIIGTIGSVANGVALPLMTLIFGSLTNAFGNNQHDTSVLVHQVSKVAIKFVYLGAGAAVASYCEVTCWMIAGERQAAHIRSLYLRAILRQDVPFFDLETTTGAVVGRMAGDTILIQDAIGEKVGKFQQLLSTFVGGFAVAFFKGWKLTLVMVATLPLLVFSFAALAAVMSKTSSKGQLAYAEAGTTVEQVVSAIRTVSSYTGENKSVQEYDRALAKAEKAGIMAGAASGLGIGFALMTMFLSYALAMWYGSILVADHGASGGSVISVVFAVLTGGSSLGQAAPCVSAFAAGKTAAYKMFEVIKRIPVIDASNMKGKVLNNLKGEIELCNIEFTYPTRPDVKIFEDLNLKIAAGTTVALVGESGSGKSTVVSLVERFYDPISGQVLVDGVDIRLLQLRWLRQQVGLVSQEPVLFGTSIRENIAYGKEDAKEEEIQAAAMLANASNFIRQMPEGFNTQVGERGIQLSGGQKQRVAIARAILKNPRILLLDEATSALDAESEKIVQEALEKVMVGRTTVVVAHRLTTIRSADLIAVIEHGVVVETGTHEELLSNPNGAYSQLVHLQQIYKHQDKDLGLKPELDTCVSDNFIHGDLQRSSDHSSSGARNIIVNSPRNSVTVAESAAVFGSGGQGEDGPQAAAKKIIRHADTSVFRLAALNKPELPLFIVGSIAAAANGTAFPVFGLLLSNVISSFYLPNKHKLRHDANFWSLMYVVLAVGIFIVAPAQSFSFGLIGQRLIRRLRRMTFDKVLRQEIAWFDVDENSSGAIGARLSTDAAAVKGMVGDTLSLIVQNIGTIVCGLTIAFVSNWQLALVILALVPLLGMQGFIQMKFMQGFSNDAKEAYQDASRVANDAISSIRTVSSFCAEEKVVRLYQKKCQKPLRSGICQGYLSGVALGFSNFVLFASYGLSFWFGARLVDQKKTSFSNVFRVFFAITMSAIGVSQAAGLSPDLTKVKIAVNSVFALLDRESKIDPLAKSGKTLKVVKGEVELQHISFTYPTRPTVPIFQDLSLTVHAGKTVALVGESGSGKSTIISLIERFYDPDSGQILIDGIDIKQFQVRWLRQQIGLVSQEPILFNTTIRENISYGRDDVVPNTEIEAASKVANAHKFITALPDGFNTTVGERGVQLSGGQKQRVAIARAIVKDPKILLLDEATSALDAESEHVVQEALDRVMVHRSTIVVAHRLSTIRNADVIAVVKNGTIVEQGKHAELMAKQGGAYSALVMLHLSAT